MHIRARLPVPGSIRRRCAMSFAKLAAFLSPNMSGDPTSERSSETDPLGFLWLQAMLQTAMEQVMAGEGTPLQKAGAVSRLANLYLRTCRVEELRQAKRELTRRVRELENHLAAAEQPGGGDKTAASDATASESDRPSSAARSEEHTSELQ